MLAGPAAAQQDLSKVEIKVERIAPGVAVLGLLIAMIVNLFVASSALTLGISIVGVLLFAGLTAYDTQKIKSMYAHVAGTDMMGKVVIMGALNLYLDFINMFTFLLSFMGNRE